MIIGQSGGPTAVINSSLAGIIKAARVNGAKKIYGMHHGIEGFLKEDLMSTSLPLTELHFLGPCDMLI